MTSTTIRFTTRNTEKAVYPSEAPALATSGLRLRHASAGENESAYVVGSTHVASLFVSFPRNPAHRVLLLFVSSHELAQQCIPCLSCGRHHRALVGPHDELSHASPAAPSSSTPTSSVRTPPAPDRRQCSLLALKDDGRHRHRVTTRRSSGEEHARADPWGISTAWGRRRYSPRALSTSIATTNPSVSCSARSCPAAPVRASGDVAVDIRRSSKRR
jgi:hypothetical protein